MSALTIGDRVRVLRSHVHPHHGVVIALLPTRIRVQFPAGGYGGTAYIEDFAPDRLEKLGLPSDDVAAGQIWQRKTSDDTYLITDAGGSTFAQDIVLSNRHTRRTSRISVSGLRAKFIRRHDLDAQEKP